MTEALADAFVSRCFLKASGSAAHITQNNFLRFCRAYKLVDSRRETGLPYGDLGLWFSYTVKRMPEFLTERERKRMLNRGLVEPRRSKKGTKSAKRRSSKARRSIRGSSNSSSDDEKQKGGTICGIAQLAVLIEQLFIALPMSLKEKVSPMHLVLSLIEAEPASPKPAVKEARPERRAPPVPHFAAPLPNSTCDFGPGFYRITHSGTVVRESSRKDSSEVGVLSEGTIAQVVEVVKNESERRIWARLKEPPSWFSIFDMESDRRTAELVGVI